MKRYVKSSKTNVKATSEDYSLVHMKIEDLFKELADSMLEIDPEADHHQIADFIAQHMVEFRDQDEWENLAFDWLQMNYR